jgi:predicted transcriptional regulator
MRIHINLPDDLVDDIDAIAGERKRSEYISEAVGVAVKRDRLRKAIAAGSGILDAKKYPYWETPEKVASWIRESRAIPSSAERNRGELPAGYERSDRVAEELSEGGAASDYTRRRRR